MNTNNKLNGNAQAIYERFLEIREEKERTGTTNRSKYPGLRNDTLEKSPENAETTTPVSGVAKGDGQDDGKISLKEKIVNFGKGVIAPIKTMFSSPKNIAVSAAAIAGGAALIALTGGAAAPVMVAAGVIGGTAQIGKGIYKQVKAKTDDEARQAWQQIGSGAFTTGVSAAGAKASLRTSGVSDVKNMSTLSAVLKCIKDSPKNIVKSVSTAGAKISAFINSLSAGQGVSINPRPEIIDGDWREIDTPKKPNQQQITTEQQDILQIGTTKKPQARLTAEPEPLRLEPPKDNTAPTQNKQLGFFGKLKAGLKSLVNFIKGFIKK